MHTFVGKCVLVTGAGRGIGKRLALGFSQQGAKVGLMARTKAEIDLTHLEIQHSQGQSLRLRADVRDAEEVGAAIERMTMLMGSVDILVHAAAVLGPIGLLTETPPKAWWDALQINLQGAAVLSRAVLRGMIERRQGKILLLAGPGAAASRPNFSAYAASQAALVRLGECLADEVRNQNIQVNCLDPGPAYTHMTEEIIRAGSRAGRRDQEEALHTRMSGGTSLEKQLAMAFFLASDRSNHISGKFLHVSDSWKKLEVSNLSPELFTLRRVQKLGQPSPNAQAGEPPEISPPHHSSS